jgi:hypothetical protein
MICPRKSMGSPVTMGASGTGISLAFGGRLAGWNAGRAGAAGADDLGAGGALAATGRGAGADGAAGGSTRRSIPRSIPANLDLIMFGMTFVF